MKCNVKKSRFNTGFSFELYLTQSQATEVRDLKDLNGVVIDQQILIQNSNLTSCCAIP